MSDTPGLALVCCLCQQALLRGIALVEADPFKPTLGKPLLGYVGGRLLPKKNIETLPKEQIDSPFTPVIYYPKTHHLRQKSVTKSIQNLHFT